MISVSFYQFIFVIQLFLFQACQPQQNQSIQVMAESPYDLNQPNNKIKLSSSLMEISGLTYWSDSLLACVNDEKGNVYFFDLNKEEVVSKHDFGKNDDYEGIEKVGTSLYITNSSGTLFEINHALTDSEQVVVFNTALKPKNNIEGLGYHPSTNSLLLACKDVAGINKSYDEAKSVYSWNIDSKSLSDKPFLIIDLEKIRKRLNRKKSGTEKIREFFGSGSGNLTFKPSGIAVHPISGDIYLIAHQGSKMIVMNERQKIKTIYPLPGKIFKQPEGICFLPNGTLIISNEGVGGKANLLVFEYLREDS